ncbi:MAG: N-acetyl-gamma-glutamyl-phosphate reductase [Aggregatilineales bacterium]
MISKIQPQLLGEWLQREDNPPIRVGIFGATGYAGQTLIGLLAKHPRVRVGFATSESVKDSGKGENESCRIPLIPAAEAPLDQVDAVFLCLPNGVSGGVAAKAVAVGVRVIDFSADLRLDSVDVYKTWYKMDHPAPQLLPAPYGLPEIAGLREKIAAAAYVANPGCHCTATLLALYPLAAANALTADPVIADTKTGVSGAGKALKPDSMFVEVYGDVKPYNIGRVHRHVPEIEQELHKLQPDAGPLILAPHLIPIDVGLLATVYVRLRSGWTLERAREAFVAAYKDEPLVELLPAGQTARIRDVARTNGAQVAISAGAGDTLIITSAIDNLRKGAASQAVQSFNLMFGLPETMGLL